MGWADTHIEKLKKGETVQFRPKGNSMSGKINDGQLCTIVPITADPKKGDIVLCKVNGNQYLHLITAIKGPQIQISNNFGHINGQTSRDNIFGILTKVEK